MIDPLEYLRLRLQEVDFYPYPWDGEDRNIGAFRSREELVAWYCQAPCQDGEPYRDRAFYTRELARVSILVRPRRIVEFGTCQGIGTCLLHWLNPQASLVTVDIRTETFMPGDQRVPTGHLAIWNKIPHTCVQGRAQDYRAEGVDLCFIDGDHGYDAVSADSERAWQNRSTDGHKWAIVWHDHNDRHPGVMRAVAEFCRDKSLELCILPDSDTVWVQGTQQ